MPRVQKTEQKPIPTVTNIAKVSQTSHKSDTPQEIKKPDFFETLDSFFTKKLKDNLNFYINGTASALNLLPFITSNFNILGFFQEKLELAGEYGSKIATVCQGLLNSIDNSNKRNLIPALGAFLELPVAALSSPENLWLYRGFALAPWNLTTVMQERPTYDCEGKTISNGKDGIKTIGGNFKEQGLGFIDSVKINLREIPKLIKELFKRPSKIIELSYGLFTSSSLQVVGALSATLGLKKLGATFRNIGAVGVDLSFTQDKDLANLKKLNKAHSKGTLKFGSSFVKAGLIWITAAIADWVHHFGLLADKVKNIPNLVLTIDRFATFFNVKGVLGITGDVKTKG